jgi:uncharacterized protein (TIRG00374 family)
LKLLKIFLISLGIYILYITVRSVGIGTLIFHILQLRWKLLPLLLFYPFIFAFDTLGWRYAFPEKLPSRVPFKDLFLIRIIGEMLNAVIPFSASLGGEPVKAELLKQKHDIPLAEGLASILIVHTTFWLSLNIFVIGGVLLTFKSHPLSPVLWNSVLAFLLGLGFVAVFLIIGLHFGIFKRMHALGDRMKWWKKEASSQKAERFLKLDSQIREFYGSNKKRFFLSAFFNFLGWFAGTFEVYYIARILGMDIGFVQAWLLEALIQVLRIVTFFIPSSIGAQEGGIVLIFSEFGFADPVSLAFAIIRRLREMVWIGIGLVLWALIKDKPALRRN